MGIGANSQERKIRKEISNCSYDEGIKDYLFSIINQILDYPRKNSKAKFTTKTINKSKIIIVYYPMEILLEGKNFKVPIQINVSQRLPYEPPQIYLEKEKDFIINKINKDIFPNNYKVITNSLKNWNPDSNINTIMDEIYSSFSNNFPFIKENKNIKEEANKINVDLNAINSLYILEAIISNIKEKKKLEIFKYNKINQNKLNISLLNYKLFRGVYKIAEKNGKGKEFIGKTDICIFEGEYINGKRNGKGKEYDEETGRLSFEGEYLDGKRHGKGKEYDCWLGTLVSEGEYLNGEKIGKRKEYYFNGFTKFEGEYSNGNIWNGIRYSLTNHSVLYEIKKGKGIIKYFDGELRVIFAGEYSNGVNGQGKEYNSKGQLKFEGEYLNGIRNGKGKEYNNYNELVFEGEYLNGKKWSGTFFPSKGVIKNGKGKVKQYDIEVEYINGEINGKIVDYWNEDIIKYEFIYINGKINGKVKTYYSNGQPETEIEYLNGEKHGKGKEYYSNGLIEFEGECLYGHRIKGQKYYENGKFEFEGSYLFDKKYNGKLYDFEGNLVSELINGKGKIKEYSDFGQLIFEGEYLNGKKNGIGKEYRNNGKLLFEGEYLNGQWKKGKEYGDEWIGYKIKYEGEFKNGVPNGKGKEYDAASRLMNEGEYINGKLNGKGIKYHYNSDKIEYEGDFINGKKNGKGKEYYESGVIKYEGEFLKGKRSGKGKEYYNKGELKFEGEYLYDDIWDGKGYDKNNKNVFIIIKGNGYVKEYNDDGILKFEGEYMDGMRNGKGKQYDKDGKVIYEGEFKDGKRHGKGKLFDEEGKIIYEGEFVSGLREGESRDMFHCGYGHLNLLNGLFDY